MKQRQNFNSLVELATKQTGLSIIKPVIEKEILHYDILFALQTTGLLKDLVFQGGTSLRLCHGSSRYSEDLDFAGGEDFRSEHILEMKNCLETYIGDRYGLEVIVKEPKSVREEMHRKGINVDAWQLSITTSPEQRHLKKQRIKIEVANIKAHTKEFQKLKNNYHFLPDAYDEILIGMESLDEIKADKIVSLPAVTSHIRNRDIWDILWLSQRTQGIRDDLVSAKIEEYNIENYQEKMENIINGLDDIIHGETFKKEMERFLSPEAVNKFIHNKEFLGYLSQEVKKVFTDAHFKLYKSEEKEDIKFAI